jgi:shikimate kinase
MTITIEPALTSGSGVLIPSAAGGWRTKDGQPLLWFEETVAVTDSGCRVLTQLEIPPEERNLVLIGMPGTGKSTVGHALSARLGRPFFDLDDLIEEQQGQRLEEIIHDVGFEGFLDVEAEAAIHFDRRGTVLATGGSVVYRPEAMLALQQMGTVVFLHTRLNELERRLSDLKQRGVVVEESQSLADLFHQREPLYECWHDLKLETAGHAVEETVHEIAERIK